MVDDRRISGDEVAAAPLQSVGRHLVFTAKALRVAFEDMLRRSGASLGTWIVLSALSEEGVVSQKVLAGHVHVEGATITHHLDRLERQGLVRRLVDPDDRRVRRIEPTPEGVRLHERLRAEAQAFERAVLAGLSESDRAKLHRLLDRVASNLESLAT